MPASEIDDIFAAKGKVNPTPSTSKLPDPASNKEKKQKKRKRAAQVQADQQPPIRTAPETVIDPSLRLSVPTKQRAKPEADDQPEKKRRKSQKEDEERFKDSRGTGPSMFSPVDVPICLYHAVPPRAQDRGRILNIQRGRTWHHRSRRRYAAASFLRE
ncbi:hypothetical protein PHLCEN_2v5344 [Hermanssonia centrifuga]|uniref:Uncharacterized protein n=1 Tax=Hermanssonia centrifuga TaxID=98765 RepID=A0A2R6P5J3_9APHY|nr:hypothetical protein PHLCEN_2v5344 [Hermanssonia centrifuga]